MKLRIIMVLMVMNEIAGCNGATRLETLFTGNNIILNSKSKLNISCFGRTNIRYIAKVHVPVTSTEL